MSVGAANGARRGFASVVDALCGADEGLLAGRRRHTGGQLLPSREAVATVMDQLRAVLFPRHFGAWQLASGSLRAYVGAKLEDAQVALTEQVRRGLAFTCPHGRRNVGAGDSVDVMAGPCPPCAREAARIADALVERLPAIRRLLEEDVLAAHEGDPASRFIDETLLCYPGIAAITQHRIAHQLYKLSVPLIPRIISELAHAATGIDIHPGAAIGPRFFIDHGTGVVIGETAAIGQRVRIYQGVTLGARGFPSNDLGHPIKGLPRHPVVEDDVAIYAGATILGRITIGRGATIGGNVWITRDVPPGSRITQAQGRHSTFQDGAGI